MEAILATNRYNPQVLPELEAHLDQQCEKRTYDAEANLALLKLYHFHPEKSDTGRVAKALAKALMQLPTTDYLMCTYLVPERVQEEPLVAALAEVAALLETCAFVQVWPALEQLRSDLLDAVPGFDDAIRQFVLDTMAITYQVIPEEHLCHSLNLTREGLTPLLTARGWKCEGGLVSVTLNADNTAKPKKPDESGFLRHDQMTKILSSIGAMP